MGILITYTIMKLHNASMSNKACITFNLKKFKHIFVHTEKKTIISKVKQSNERTSIENLFTIYLGSDFLSLSYYVSIRAL